MQALSYLLLLAIWAGMVSLVILLVKKTWSWYKAHREAR